MPVTNPNYAEGFPRAGYSPALDALQQLGSASPGSGMVANPHRLTEAPDAPVDPFPSGANPPLSPPPATPPAEVPGWDQMLTSLKMAYPANRTGAPLQNMAPERREKPSIPAFDG
jgi:hypothetical protein